MNNLIGKLLADLPTPAFCVDLDVVERNCQKMLDTAKRYGVQLRAQMKTHKTVEGAALMTGGTKRCIVVSTLAEAEFYADNDFDDILYGYPLSPNKFERCKNLSERLNNFHILIDNQAMLDELKKSCSQTKWSIFLKVDCGYGRAGVWWQSEEGIRLAKEISSQFKFAGVYVHCGNSYSASAHETNVQNVENETISNLLNFVKRLGEANTPCPTVGIGSTPSCSQPVESMKSLTEIHPGNYVFYDAQQHSIGSCSLNEIACTVATRVVGHYPHRNEMLIDCGFTALTKQGKDLLPGGFVIFPNNSELKLKDMTQEVGKVTTVDGSALDFKRYPIGHMFFMHPYHSCATAAMHGHYNVHRNGKIVEIWKPCRGW
jgi:D-serine deaminase-like pyridoxal phosphate-dependent protein